MKAMPTVSDTFNMTAVLPQQTIYNDDGIVAKTVSLQVIDPRKVQNTSAAKESLPYVGVDLTKPYVGLNVTIENKSKQTVTPKAVDITVNGVTTCSSSTVADVKPGETLQECFSLGNVELFNLAGITNIASIDFFIMFGITGTQQEFGLPVTLLTSAGAGNSYQKPDRGETVLYDKEGVKIACLGMNKDGSYSSLGPGMMLYIENKTPEDFNLDIKDDALINNISVSDKVFVSLTEWQIYNIQPNTRAYSCVVVDDFTLSKLGIHSTGDIRTLECSFTVKKTADNSVTAETPTILLNF
jgi:hypothetical protein